MYDGAIRRELVGAEITERALISSALNIGDETRAARRRRPAHERDWRYRLREHRGTLLAFAGVRRRCSRSTSPTIRSASTPTSRTTAANKGVLLAIVAMAQTLVVLTAGIDLSVGMVMVLTNCLASCDRRRLAAGDGARRARRARRPASLCGAINGADRDLRPAAADRHHDRHRRDLLRRSRWRCAAFPAATSTPRSPTR